MSGALLSIVIPAYNEARRLGPTLAGLRDWALKTGRAVEVVVVDDGSRDGTAEVARGVDLAPLAIRIFREPENRGKGYAVRHGVAAVTGETVLLCDADLSGPIEELARLEPWLTQGYDVVIGSRDLPGSRLAPPQPCMRRLLARSFRALRRRLLLPGVRDTQCGFKLFAARAARDVFARVRSSGWLFDCEALAVADRLGYRIREVDITWRNDPDSRVRVLPLALRAPFELLAIRRRVRRLPPAAKCHDRAAAGRSAPPD